MSAWLCGNKTLSLVVDVIKTEEFKWDFDPEDYHYKSEEELINLLSDLNTESLDWRYGEDECHVLQDREYFKLDVEDGQRFKSVSCYTYQTCESPICRDHPLFKALENWEDANTDKFKPTWDKYHWDIDNPAPRWV